MSINQLGNRIHRRTWGKLAGQNWTTWLDHTIVAAAIAVIGAGLGALLLGDWLTGARVFAPVGALFYVVREIIGYGDRGGGKVLDSLMDPAGPVLLAVLVWLL